MFAQIMYFLKPLFLTLLFEVPVSFLMGIRRKDLLLVVLVNMITNPLLCLVCRILMYNLGIGTYYYFFLAILEILVVYVEYLYFHRYLSDGKSALRLSLILNLVSFIGGLIC